MTDGPHTLGVGYGSLLVWRALRVWIRSRLNSSGKCRLTVATGRTTQFANLLTGQGSRAK